MSAITLLQAQTALTNWIDAEAAVALGQSYQIGSRSLTRAHSGEITKKIIWWSALVERMQNGGGIRTTRIVARDQ